MIKFRLKGKVFILKRALIEPFNDYGTCRKYNNNGSSYFFTKFAQLIANQSCRNHKQKR